MGLALLSLSIDAGLMQPVHATLPVLAALMIWAVCHWAFYPAQQARLIELAGVHVASIVLSLNASFMYIGFSVGAAVGGVTLAHSHIGNLGLVGGFFELASVAVTLAIFALTLLDAVLDLSALRGCCPPVRAAGRLNCGPCPTRGQWQQARGLGWTAP